MSKSTQFYYSTENEDAFWISIASHELMHAFDYR